MALELKRPAVAAKYELTTDTDVRIHIGCYSGMLSNINECGAAELLKSQSPLIIEKTADPGDLDPE